MSPKDNLIPEEASHATTKSEYAGNEAAEHVIVIKGVREGTTAIDMRVSAAALRQDTCMEADFIAFKTILEDFGQVTYCKEVQASDIPAGTLAFEAGFKAVEGAKKAVKELESVYTMAYGRESYTY